jgi:hypothetical protein
MPLTIHDIVEMIDAELSQYNSHASSVVEARSRHLRAVKDFLISAGYPSSKEDKLNLSLHPFYFQEVNYDDLDIYSLNGDRGHLTNAYDIDLAVQTGGYTRKDITEPLYESYCCTRSEAIEYRRESQATRDSANKAGFFRGILRTLTKLQNFLSGR